MITKEKLHQHIDKFPDQMSIEEAIDRLIFVSKLESRLQETTSGSLVSHDQAKQDLSKWLK